MRKTLPCTLVAFLVLVLFTTVGLAAPIAYSDYATWEAASSNLETIGFEGLVTNSEIGFSYLGTSEAIGGFNFQSNSTQQLMAIEESYSSGGYSLGSGSVLLAFNAGLSVVSGIGDITSFGVDLRGAIDNPTFCITLSTGETFSTTFENSYTGFFGITSDTGISSISISPETGYIIMDNFSYGDGTPTLAFVDEPDVGNVSPAPVPEPATMLLLGSGLIGIAGFMRKNKE